MPVSVNKLVLGGTALALATAPAMIASAVAEPPAPRPFSTTSTEAERQGPTSSTAQEQEKTTEGQDRHRSRRTTTSFVDERPQRTVDDETTTTAHGPSTTRWGSTTSTWNATTSTTRGSTTTTTRPTTSTTRATTTTTRGSTTTSRPTTTTTAPTTTTTAATTTTTGPAPTFRLTQVFVATAIGRPIELDTTVANGGTGPSTITLTIALHSTGFNLPGYLNPQSKPAWLSCSPAEIQSPSTSGTFTCTGTIPAATSGIVVISSGSNIAGTAGQALSSTGSLQPAGLTASAAAVLV